VGQDVEFDQMLPTLTDIRPPLLELTRLLLEPADVAEL
jgi:hypothetical protein